MLFTLFLFDFFVLCLLRKAQLSVVAVFSGTGCLNSYRQKQSPVQIDIMEGLLRTSVRSNTTSCMAQKESSWLFVFLNEAYVFCVLSAVVQTTYVRCRVLHLYNFEHCSYLRRNTSSFIS